MLVKKIVSFFLGAALASAWWQVAMFKYGNGDEWVVAVAVTAIVIVIIILNFIFHVNDK